MAVAPPSSALVERFRADLEKLTGGSPGRLGIAVSGGPDSLALLLLANAAFPGQIEAATVDHGLRAESATEAEYVASVCQKLSVPHVSIRLDWPSPPGANLQARAREARYAELGAWAADRQVRWVATAHHLDDQAETLLMRLARGSGIGGLCGIRPIGLHGDEARPVWLIRPVLGWTRAELRDVVAAADLQPVDDPSNRDERFDRTRARELLAATPWLAPERLAAAAANLADAEEALAAITNKLFSERVAGEAPGFDVRAADLPREIQRRLVRDVLRLLTGEEPSGPKLLRLLEAVRGGGTATLGGIKAIGGEVWRFEPAPPRRSG